MKGPYPDCESSMFLTLLFDLSLTSRHHRGFSSSLEIETTELVCFTQIDEISTMLLYDGTAAIGTRD